MSGADGQAHLFEEWMVSRNSWTVNVNTLRGNIVPAVRGVEGRIDLGRLSCEKSHEMGDGPIRLGEWSSVFPWDASDDRRRS